MKIKSQHFPNGEELTIQGYVNEDGWFGKTWLIGVGCGFSCFFYIVEAGSESDAIDELVDSQWGHMLVIPEEEYDENHHHRAGNAGLPVDLTEVRVLERCTILTK